jgi:Na+-transporting methylmalonyl-CoA/oxaloacetate decarboxylase gamma subunit
MNTEAIYQALEVMWKGMASIFTVIILLTIIVYLLGKFTKEKDKKESQS